MPKKRCWSIHPPTLYPNIHVYCSRDSYVTKTELDLRLSSHFGNNKLRAESRYTEYYGINDTVFLAFCHLTHDFWFSRMNGAWCDANKYTIYHFLTISRKKYGMINPVCAFFCDWVLSLHIRNPPVWGSLFLRSRWGFRDFYTRLFDDSFSLDIIDHRFPHWVSFRSLFQ